MKIDDKGIPLVVVLVNDADEMYQISEALQREGYRVLGYIEPEKALEQVNSGHTSLVIVDIHLAGAEAHGLLRNIKKGEGSSNIPAIAIVGSEKEKYLEDGTVDAFLTRPIDAKSLVTLARCFIKR